MKSGPKIRPNSYQIRGEVVYLALTQGKESIIDLSDLQRVLRHRWCAARTGALYVQGRVEGKMLPLHRFIMRPAASVEIDHKNGDGLDNRKSNLRVCPGTENRFNLKRYSNNTSGFKGVSWNRRCGKWISYISSGGRRRHLGLFRSKHKAARVYDAEARILFGEFARLNFQTVSTKKSS